MKRRLSLGAIGAVLVLGACSAAPVDGVVVDREYIPSRTSTGSGVSSDGKPVVVTTHESEKWMLLLEVEDKVIARCVDKLTWARAEVGEEIFAVEGQVC